jgi:hypothetical protein
MGHSPKLEVLQQASNSNLRAKELTPATCLLSIYYNKEAESYVEGKTLPPGTFDGIARQIF